MLARWTYVTVIIVLCGLGCADRRAPVAQEHLSQQVATQSAGALAFVSMTKTNGFEHEREGMKLYTVEWEATLRVNEDGWKAGWRDFQVAPKEPNALAAAVEGASVRRLLRGGSAVLQGKSEMQKADRGWRVLTWEVTGSKIERPPDAPNEGRSTDINAFFQAFKAAVATRNNQTLIKFIQFPSQRDVLAGRVWMPADSEGQLLAQGFPFSDEEVNAMMKVAAPRKHEDGSYDLPTDYSALTFTKNRDGYWKWTNYYIAEGGA